jgi:pyruvate,orthophosphate dikinase
MRKVALTYKNLVQDHGIQIPPAPFDQLVAAIRSVFASWHSPKAVTYRKIMGISDDWGTAVTVQKMVFGNRRSTSGTGVFFTHNPRWSGDILKLWGDFTVGNQGEDVVSGLVTTLPISVFQQEYEMRDTDITLETHYPQIYNRLKDWANTLIYQHGWSPQEMEFTFESPEIEDLYLLQARDMAIRERKKVFAFDPEEIDPQRQLGHGIGVAGGAMTGRLVFSLEEIDHWRVAEPDAHLILVRGDTVPDDIKEIFAADGLLTARGGVTSHAAVVAHRLEKTCVVGCANLVCDEFKRQCRFGQVTLVSGDFISIDGQAGAVYQGKIKAHAA